VIERVRDLGKQAAHLLRGQRFGERAAAAQEMTGLDGIAAERVPFRG